MAAAAAFAKAIQNVPSCLKARTLSSLVPQSQDCPSCLNQVVITTTTYTHRSFGSLFDLYSISIRSLFDLYSISIRPQFDLYSISTNDPFSFSRSSLLRLVYVIIHILLLTSYLLCRFILSICTRRGEVTEYFRLLQFYFMFVNLQTFFYCVYVFPHVFTLTYISSSLSSSVIIYRSMISSILSLSSLIQSSPSTLSSLIASDLI